MIYFLNFPLLFHPYGLGRDTCSTMCSWVKKFMNEKFSLKMHPWGGTMYSVLHAVAFRTLEVEGKGLSCC